MNSEIIEMILEKHDRIIKSEGRNVILFLNYTLCHPETIQAHLTNIKPHDFLISTILHSDHQDV